MNVVLLEQGDAIPEVIESPAGLDGLREITVEAWVEAAADRPEAMQALVSKWTPPDEWPGFAAYDAGRTDGLNATGYFGAVFDGRYLYGAPEQHGDASTHGVVLRYDTQGDFKDAESYAAYDASNTDGIETRGFYGAVCTGRYVYFVPRQLDMHTYHTHLLRLDTQGEFKDPGSWSGHDVGVPHSHQGAAFDGRYLYLCPGFQGDPAKEDEYSSRVVRCDTQGDFKNPSSYRDADITEFLGADAACFDGGAFDGRYIYFVPLYGGVVVRYDTRREFEDPESWGRYDARPHGYELSVGAVFDGRHLYFCAYGHAKIVRFDTDADFGDPASWETRDADHTDGLRTTGFDGGFFDGRFVYFQPFFLHVGPGKRDNLFHSNYLRYDPTRPFDDPGSWQAFNASETNGLKSVGYNGGAFDGRYFYAAPWQQGRLHPDDRDFVTHGILLRCDTLGDHGSFSLRYCDCGHNGGLCAAVPGPSFLVNTHRGVITASAHYCLPAGRHHLAGSYDGKHVRLHVDGERVAEREGSGRIVANREPIAVGRIHRGMGRFQGAVNKIRISGMH